MHCRIGFLFVSLHPQNDIASMNESTQWIITQITDFCERYGNRLAGSAATWAATDKMAAMAEHWSDRVEKETFTMHPTAFMGSITIQVILGLAAIILWWTIRSWLVPIILVVWLISWWGEYWTYRRIFDRLHPKAEGQNVLAVLKAAEDTRRRVIITAHADAAYEMRFLLHLKSWQVVVLIVLADCGSLFFLVSSLLSLSGLTSPGYDHALSYILIPIACVLFAWLFFVNWHVVSPGANDNLTGCFTALALLREMAANNQRLTHTDFCVLITDGEECGLRGAMAFAERHERELYETDTLVVAADTFHDKEQLKVYPRGINFTQKNSPKVCSMLRRAGRHCGITLPDVDFYPGATDAEAFSRRGIKAAAICASPISTGPYYHTRYDAPDSLSPESIEAATDILREFLRLADESTHNQ